MEKVKLTADQHYRLEQTKFYYEDYQNLILKNYLEGSLIGLYWEDLTFLYEFNIEELMNILLGNFEIKKEGIELVRDEFYKVKLKFDKTEKEIGYLNGIYFAVKTLGFKLNK